MIKPIFTKHLTGVFNRNEDADGEARDLLHIDAALDNNYVTLPLLRSSLKRKQTKRRKT